MTTAIRGLGTLSLKVGSLYDYNDPRVGNLEPEARIVVVIQRSEGEGPRAQGSDRCMTTAIRGLGTLYNDPRLGSEVRIAV